MVVGGAESSKSEFGTTALSFKTNPQSVRSAPCFRTANFKRHKLSTDINLRFEAKLSSFASISLLCSAAAALDDKYGQ